MNGSAIIDATCTQAQRRTFPGATPRKRGAADIVFIMGFTDIEQEADLDAETKPLSLKQNMLWNSIGSFLYLFCQWAITVLVVRLSSGYDSAGVLAIAMSIGNLFTPFAIYKMRTYQVSDTSGEYSTGQYVAFRLITIAIALVGCSLYAVLTCRAETYLTIFTYLVFKAIDIFIDVLHGLDQQKMRMDYIGKSLIARGLLSLIAFCLMLWWTGNINLAVLGMVISTLPVCVFYDMRVSSKLDDIRPHISFDDAVVLLRKCFPLVIASVFCSAILTIPRQYLSYGFGDALLGIYSSVAAPIAVIQIGATYIYSPLLGIFAEDYNQGAITKLRQLMLKTTLGILALAIICLVLFHLFGEWGLVLLYGESIREHASLMYPIIICTVLTGFLWFLADLLVSIREFRGNVVGNIIALLVSLGTTVPLVNTFTMNGVSFVGIAACVLGIVIMAWYLRRSMHTFPGTRGDA